VDKYGVACGEPDGAFHHPRADKFENFELIGFIASHPLCHRNRKKKESRRNISALHAIAIVKFQFHLITKASSKPSRTMPNLITIIKKEKETRAREKVIEAQMEA
jgi:hypothetical protein